MIHESRGKCIAVLAYTGEERRGRRTYGWTANNDDTVAIHSRYVVVWRLLLLSSTAILPAGARLYLAYDTVIMDFSSTRPFLCFLPSIYANPLHTRSASYLQYYELIEYHTVPLGSNLSLLQSLSASFTTCLTDMRGTARRASSRRGEAPLYTYVMFYRFGADRGQLFYKYVGGIGGGGGLEGV